MGDQVEKTSGPPFRGRSFFETLVRALITLSAGTAVVLSSISVCDGHWLSSPDGRLFGVWGSAELGAVSRGMVAVRSAVSLAVVLAIFGLELLMVSQLCDDGHSRRRWRLGAVLLLAAFFLAAAGTLTYVLLLRDLALRSAFSLTFWCQFLGSFLFFLNGASGLYLNHLSA